MPGNIIKINNADELEWYVGDTKMEDLIEYLDKIGFREDDEGATTISSSDTSS